MFKTEPSIQSKIAAAVQQVPAMRPQGHPMKIDLPSIEDQQELIFQEATKEAISQLEANLSAPRYPAQDLVDESLYPRTHLLRENQGWEAPAPEIVKAYFRHFQNHFSAYGTDVKLAVLLGMVEAVTIGAYVPSRMAARRRPMASGGGFWS